MSKTYRGYELVQAIAEGEIKNGIKFIFRYKDDYEEKVFWNGENFCYIDRSGYLLKDASDCELIYGIFELIEDEEIDIQNIELLDPYDTYFRDGTELVYKLMYDKINEIAMKINKLDKRTRKEKE